MGTRAETMLAEARPTVHEFFALCRKRDYAGAHQLFTPEQRERLSPAEFSSRWQQFEKAHGALRGFQAIAPRAGFPSSTNLWPPWIQTTFSAKGAKSGAVVQLRLVPQNGQWRIDKMNIQL